LKIKYLVARCTEIILKRYIAAPKTLDMNRKLIRIIVPRPRPIEKSESKNSPWAVLEELLKFWPIITVSMFILGFLKLYSYYYSFQIDIVNYIGATESLFTLLPICAVIVVLFFLPLFLSMMRHNLSHFRWFSNWRLPGFALPVFLAIWAVGLGYWGYFVPVGSPLYRNIPLIRQIQWAVPGIEIFYTYIRSKRGKVTLVDVLIPLVAVGYALYSYGATSGDVVKLIGPDKSYVFKWKDKVIKSDSTLYMIGDVQNYIILYQPKDSTTRIYKRSEVDSVVIKALP
jgi:hypothetical protein